MFVCFFFRKKETTKKNLFGVLHRKSSYFLCITSKCPQLSFVQIECWECYRTATGVCCLLAVTAAAEISRKKRKCWINKRQNKQNNRKANGKPKRDNCLDFVKCSWVEHVEDSMSVTEVVALEWVMTGCCI